MERFIAALVGVIEANQRLFMRRVVLQIVILSATGFGLWRLDGGWWCVCAAFLPFPIFNVFFFGANLAEQLTLRLDPPWRALGLQPEERGGRVLEFHLFEGGVTRLPVPLVLVAGVKDAAEQAGLQLVTDKAALEALNGKSARLERLRDIEALLPHVPAPELRGELSALIDRVRTLEPTGCDEVLRELEIQLMAEKRAQTRTSLRGPKPVYEKELREKIAAITKMLDEALVVDREG